MILKWPLSDGRGDVRDKIVSSFCAFLEVRVCCCCRFRRRRRCCCCWGGDWGLYLSFLLFKECLSGKEIVGRLLRVCIYQVGYCSWSLYLGWIGAAEQRGHACFSDLLSNTPWEHKPPYVHVWVCPFVHMHASVGRTSSLTRQWYDPLNQITKPLQKICCTARISPQ